MSNNITPADTYIVVNQTILTEMDKKVLISLYEPIIGPVAVSLYLTLWSDLDKLEMISKDFNHYHLMTILKSSLEDIVSARKSLEALGLLKSFVEHQEEKSEYLYELYSPLSPYEFFNHPILSVLLLNNIGEMEYNNLLSIYKKKNINKIKYEEITSSMNETFKSVTKEEYTDELIRRQNKLGINLDNIIDFNLLESSMPKGLLNSKSLNKKTKELINQLAFIYNVDTIKMGEIIRLVIDELGNINKDKLRESVRKNYEYNNNGSLPTIVFRTQPDYLKTPVGDTTPRGKMIYVFENTKPYDYLKLKNHGVKPTSRDLKIMEHLAVDFNLPAGVINVLIDYALRVSNGKLNQKYLETIAADWSRKQIKTVVDAMDMAKKGYKKNNNISIKSKNVASVPSWMYKENKKEELNEEELKEMEELLSEFR